MTPCVHFYRWLDFASCHFDDIFVVLESVAKSSVYSGVGWFSEEVGYVAAGFYEFDEIDVGVDSEPVQEVDKVFGGEVAGGAARVWAPAQPRDGRVHSRDPELRKQVILI